MTKPFQQECTNQESLKLGLTLNIGYVKITETVDHIISGCSIIVNTEYLQRSMDALGDTKLRKMVQTLTRTSSRR